MSDLYADPRPADPERRLDELAGQVFATPGGKAWLAANADRWPLVCAEIDQRVARQRRRWGGRDT